MATFFSLPPEVRRQIYHHVFAGAQSVFDFSCDNARQPASSERKRSFVGTSNGELSLLRVSRQCYVDSIDSYHEVRIVCIRKLGEGGLDDLTGLSHVYNVARTVQLDDFQLKDLAVFPSFPKLQHLVLSGLRLWGGNLIVQRGQSALEAFNDDNVLNTLFEHPRYSSLKIEQGVSKYFPTAHIVINFNIGNQVMDKNRIRGVQDWDWACSYDVKTNWFEKRLARRLSLW